MVPDMTSGGSFPWRWRIVVSEIHPCVMGCLTAFEWWLNEDQRSVYEEKHWFNGKWIGIEREWNFENKLRRGYPKYWVVAEL